MPSQSSSQFPAVHHPHCNALCDGDNHWLGATRPMQELDRMRSEMLPSLDSVADAEETS